MCGICGFFDLEKRDGLRKEIREKEAGEKILEKMLAAIRHRGPDGSRSLVLDGAALGFNRLSFIDLDGGMQPIQNEDETISMICNGEISRLSGTS